MNKKLNGLTFRNVSIAIGIFLAIGGVVWAIAIQSGNLDRVVKDVVKTEEEVEEIDARLDMVEDIVSIIQNDLNYIRGDIAEQKELSKQILLEVMK